MAAAVYLPSTPLATQAVFVMLRSEVEALAPQLMTLFTQLLKSFEVMAWIVPGMVKLLTQVSL